MNSSESNIEYNEQNDSQEELNERLKQKKYFHINIWPIIILAIIILIIIFLPENKNSNDYYELMLEAITNQQSELVVEHADSSEYFRRAIYKIREGTPEIFFIDKVSYKIIDSTLYVYFTYKPSANNYEENLKKFNQYLDDIIKQMDENLDDYGKVKWLHDYICNNFSYGGDHDAFSMLETKQGVCSAYAALYRALLNRVGIKNEYVYGYTLDGKKTELHAWNLVKLGLFWYHVDVTWDDLESGMRYDYFLITDSRIKELKHKSWDTPDRDAPKCFIRKYEKMEIK